MTLVVESFRSTTSPEKPRARTLIEDATEAIQRLGLLSLRTRLFPHRDRGCAQVCLARLRPLGDLAQRGTDTRKVGG